MFCSSQHAGIHPNREFNKEMQRTPATHTSHFGLQNDFKLEAVQDSCILQRLHVSEDASMFHANVIKS